MHRNVMKKNILLAGGLKNHNLTSYINCTLQIFLHYQPFIDDINTKAPNEDNNLLIQSLRVLIKKLNATDTSVSSDSIVSAMKIDPKICQPINRVFSYFRFLVELSIIKFELEKCETSIQSGINNYLQESKDFSIDDLNCNFLYIHLNPNNQNLFQVDQDISIFDFSYTLYAVVQVIISPSSHNHYFVTIRDKNGWVVFNDTAVKEISDTQFNNSLYNFVTPIEILVYISDINDSKIDRRPASLQSTFIAIKPHYNQNESDNYGNPENPNRINDYGIGADSGDIESYIVQRTNYPDDEQFRKSFSPKKNEIIEVQCDSTDDEPKELHQPIRGKSLLIDSDPMRYRSQKAKEISYISDEEDQNDYKNEMHPQSQFPSFSIIHPFRKEAIDCINQNSHISSDGILFDSHRHTNVPNEECTVCLEIYSKPNEHLKTNFSINLTCDNIVEFARKSLHSLSAKIYLIYRRRCFKVSNEMIIGYITNLIDEDNLHFLAVIGNKPSEIYSFKLQVFLSNRHFKKIEDFSLLCDIDGSCRSLIDKFKKKHPNTISNPVILQYFNDTHKFKEVPMNKKVIDLLNLSNLRIQERPENMQNSIVFIYNTVPFLYEINNISKNKLISDISNYLSIDDHITLDFINNNHTVKIDDQFLAAYEKGVFSYVQVNVKKNSY